jgi:hypothetical protein
MQLIKQGLMILADYTINSDKIFPQRPKTNDSKELQLRCRDIFVAKIDILGPQNTVRWINTFRTAFWG